ncbi:MAG: hypothetical protein Q7T80_13260 [Methanoregula sp.]|nr:hypothetical protein [Methanoregula sp.]
MMKISKLFAVAIAAVFLLACIQSVYAAGGPITGLTETGAARVANEHTITVEQAKESIRVFMGDMNLEPVYESTQENFADADYYLFTFDTLIFGVNTETGNVETISFADRMPGSRTIAISQNEALVKAKVFAGKYNGFSGKTWHLVIDALTLITDNSSSYFFLFQEESDDILLPSMVVVQVNPESGEIWSYAGVNRTGEPVCVKPTFGQTEAAGIAEAGMPSNDYTIDPASGHLAVVRDTTEFRNQHLVWIFTCQDSTGANPMPMEIFVDATEGTLYPLESFPFQAMIDMLGYLLPRV